MSNHHAQIPGRGAIKFDLFAAESRQEMIDRMSDPLVAFETQFDFGALAAKVDREVPRPVSAKGGRPPFPSETMVRLLFLKWGNNLSD